MSTGPWRRMPSAAAAAAAGRLRPIKQSYSEWHNNNQGPFNYLPLEICRPSLSDFEPILKPTCETKKLDFFAIFEAIAIQLAKRKPEQLPAIVQTLIQQQYVMQLYFATGAPVKTCKKSTKH